MDINPSSWVALVCVLMIVFSFIAGVASRREITLWLSILLVATGIVGLVVVVSVSVCSSSTACASDSEAIQWGFVAMASTLISLLVLSVIFSVKMLGRSGGKSHR